VENLAGPRGYIEYSRLLISGERGVKRETKSVEGRGAPPDLYRDRGQPFGEIFSGFPFFSFYLLGRRVVQPVKGRYNNIIVL